MNAKKRDWYGRYHDRDVNTKIALNPELSDVLASTAFGFNRECIYDLCEECAEDFEKWMHPEE